MVNLAIGTRERPAHDLEPCADGKDDGTILDCACKGLVTPQSFRSEHLRPILPATKAVEVGLRDRI